MHRRLTLRARLALLTAAAVALAVAACATASWFLLRGQLYAELDRRLAAMASGPGPASLRPGPSPVVGRALAWCSAAPQAAADSSGRFPAPDMIIQVVSPAGTGCTVPGAGALTVTAADVRVARGERGSALHNGSGIGSGGDRIDVRIFTRAVPGEGAAVSYALPLSQAEAPLGTLAVLLAAVSALGVLVSAGAGLMVARAALRPVDRLTAAVEHIARTADLDTRIPASGEDEIARLSRAFNTMTAALAASRERQRQLIADAGHELRTPLTSMGTNLDLLIRSERSGRELPATAKARMLDSLRAQMRELASLVGDLLRLGAVEITDTVAGVEPVALHTVAERAVRRARLRGPGLEIRTRLEPWYVIGDADSVERAVMNLLDNAVKFSPAGGIITVGLAEREGRGELTVADQGTGIADEDLPFVFERFWRSPSARSMPGSGLGLAIVAQVVREAGGEVALETGRDGGAVARMRLPGTPGPPG